MNIAKAFKTGISRPVKAWQGIFVTWLISLGLSLLLILPFRGALVAGYGRSLITERLTDAIDIEVLAEPGTVGTLVSSLGVSSLLVILAGFILNVFVSAGLFGGVSLFRINFWTSAGKYFWSFLLIMLLVSTVMLFFLFIAVTAATLLSGFDYAMSEMKIIKPLIMAGGVFLLLMPLFMLWADYARAWQVRSDTNRPFSALGFGLGQTFRTFLSSWIMMAMLLLVQAIYWWFVKEILPGFYSGSDGNLNLFFLIAQLLIIVKVFLRVLRYSCVTVAMEITDPA